MTLLIYLFINLFIYISSVLLYYYCLSLVSIDLLVKSRIFLSLFSRDLTLRVYRDAMLLSYLPDK